MDIATKYVAPRTCTVVGLGEETRDATGSAAPLSDYANTEAYVLVAEPGAGKTTAFKTEAVSQEGSTSRFGTSGPSRTNLSGMAQRSFWTGSTSLALGQRMAGLRSTTSGESCTSWDARAFGFPAGGPTGRRQTTVKH